MIIGVGCDIVALDRVASLMQKDGYVRILTMEELACFQQYHGQRQLEWLAGRFAAKEAIIKAMAQRQSLLLSQIAILSDDGRPTCHLDGVSIHLSIAHETTYAIAYAIAEV